MLRRKLSPMLLGSALAAIAVAGPAQAFDASLGGQVDRMVRYGSNGTHSTIQQMDNGVENSRFHFMGSGEVTDGITAGVYTEIGLNANDPENFNQDVNRYDLTSRDTSDNQVMVRWAEVFFESDYGKVSAGKGEDSTRGIPYMTLSNTNLVDGNDFRNWEGVTFRSNNVRVARIGDVFSNYDGQISSRLRYDTPNLDGFVGSVSSQEREYSGAVRYHGNFDQVEMLGGVSYDHDIFQNGAFNVTASALLPNGFNGTVAFGSLHHSEHDELTPSNNNSTNWLGMLGYRINDCAFSVSWGQTRDLDMDGDRATHYGVAFQKHIPSVNMDAYVGYEHFSLSRSSEDSISDINGAIAGARIKF